MNIISLLLLVLIPFSNSFANLKAEDYDSTYQTSVRAELHIDPITKIETVTIQYNSDLNVCNNSGDVSGIVLNMLVIVGEGDRAKSHKVTLHPQCPKRGAHAIYRFNSRDGLNTSPLSWDNSPKHFVSWGAIFPEYESGKRWYALRLAFVTSHRGSGLVWDSKNGFDYRLVFE